MLIWGPVWVLFWGSWGGRLPAAAKRHESRRMAWTRASFAIRVLLTALEGGQQQLKYTNHDGWLDPGRWPAAAKRGESRRMARARACRREAQNRNPRAIYSTWRGQQQRTDANHDAWLELGSRWGRGGGGALVRAPCRGVGGSCDNTRQIRLFHMPRYTVEHCAADCQRFASTAAHFTFSI